MKPDTVVTALADGASQLLVCDLESVPHCQQLICILDWFHIAKQFQNVRGAVDEAYIETG